MKKRLGALLLASMLVTPTLTVGATDLDTLQPATPVYEEAQDYGVMPITEEVYTPAGYGEGTGGVQETTGSNIFSSVNAGIDESDIAAASVYASPIVSLLGWLGGFILVVTLGFLFFITACDIMYLTVPFLRGVLGEGKYRVVSDEAKAALGASGDSGASSGGMGGYGGGMGDYGGGMGGYGGGMGGDTNESSGGKSVLFTYLKSRMFFLIIFGIVSIVLTTSVFLDCGINVGNLVLKIMNTVNGSIAGL